MCAICAREAENGDNVHREEEEVEQFGHQRIAEFEIQKEKIFQILVEQRPFYIEEHQTTASRKKTEEEEDS